MGTFVERYCGIQNVTVLKTITSNISHVNKQILCTGDVVTSQSSTAPPFVAGNDFLHSLTASGWTELRVDLEDFEGERRYAAYSSFSVASASDNYELIFSGYNGTAGRNGRSNARNTKPAH